jgi:S1-C subfamily serine protease
MDIAAGEPAEEGCLQVGDMVTAIDGAPVSAKTLSDVRHSLKLVPVGTPLTVTAQRDGKTW